MTDIFVFVCAVQVQWLLFCDSLLHYQKIGSGEEFL